MASKITPRAENYSEWYVNIVLNAQLADYSPMKGTMVIRPRGYAIWERMRAVLDEMFRETGHENAYFPLLIPESFLHKEAEHVAGFSPETAVVTHGGGELLDQPLVIRPTSETIIWSMYKKWIQSHRDLPIKINQWANVIRWEKRTRLFLRTTEFLWQEGHTAHETEAEAREEALTMLQVYRKFVEQYMALPVLYGRKSDAEKFAGAIDTYAIEALMQDCRALQAGTSHFLGQKFAKAFDVTFQNRHGVSEYVWASSWGVSTRLIGALIMAHSDDRGLVVPPRLAPAEVIIIPIVKNETRTAVMSFVEPLYRELRERFRVVLDDDREHSPGWRFAEWELRGVPVRIECGPRDQAENAVTLVRRDTGEKYQRVARATVASRVAGLLSEIQDNLFRRAWDFRERHTTMVNDYEEFKQQIQQQRGFVIAPWNGKSQSEQRVREETKATIRVLPFDSEAKAQGRRCIITGEPARYMAIFARNY